MLGVAVLLLSQPGAVGLAFSGVAFTLGMILFSDSLYLLALTELRWLGAITPLGGGAFLLGWLGLIWAGVKLAGRGAADDG